MTAEVLSAHELDVQCEDDIVIVRRLVRDLAGARGFDPFAIAAVTTATSELTRNTLMHGRGGKALVEEISDGQRAGLRVCLHDRGPGIADLDLAMRGGTSTTGSMGLGLSGSKRLVDEFEIDTGSDGTRVAFVKWARFS